MVEQIQDLNLPNAIVARLIKEALPENINVSKDARLAISKAASVFIIYLSSAATAEAKKEKHKMISPNNVFGALEEIEFESFIEPVKEALEAFQKKTKDKKQQAAERKKAAGGDKEESTAADTEDGADKSAGIDESGEMDVELVDDDESD